VIKKYGADTQRLYTLFIGPPQKDAEWNDDAISGAHRFLRRLWTQVVEFDGPAEVYSGDGDKLSAPAKALFRKTHQTVRKVTADIEQSWQFNTAVAAVMELSNQYAATGLSDDSAPVRMFALETMVRLLHPFVPHISEELWQHLGHQPSVMDAGWPAFDEDACREETVEYGVQVNGKLRERFTVSADVPEDEIQQTALELPKVKSAIGDAQVRKIFVVKGRLVNIVAK
ncbi:MAG: class I tRNA ligase family protein, partial [Phycisphaerae bacterium]|nr:class I tRNA ligase family protein [Phycisphaerae bacterium]